MDHTLYNLLSTTGEDRRATTAAGVKLGSKSPAAVRCLQGNGEDMGTGYLGISEVDINIATHGLDVVVARY